VEVAPLAEVQLFSGTRSLTTDNTTEYALALVSSSTYRIRWTGTGAAPGFRVDRNVAVTGGNAIVTLNANQTVTVTHSAGAVFGAVVAGDSVRIPGVVTNETAGPFDSLNQGNWAVLSATATTLVLSRASGTVFTGRTETVAITNNSQFISYSSAGVQVGDTIDIAGGFSVPTRQGFVVSQVTSSMVEFVSTVPLAQETVIPGVAAFVVYSSSNRYLYIETNQACAIKLNGAIDETNRVDPIIAGDQSKVGFFEKWGPTYSLSVKNRSTNIATITVFTAE